MDVSTQIKYFKLRTELTAIAPNSLILMRRYEVTDFPWYFLTIFYIVRRSFTGELVYFVNIKQFGRHRTAVRIFVH